MATSPTRLRANQFGLIDAVEQRWLPPTTQEVARVEQLCLSVGESLTIASGVAGWVNRLATGGEDLISGPTRATYRKVLRRLEEAGHEPPDPRRRITRDTGVLLRSRRATRPPVRGEDYAAAA